MASNLERDKVDKVDVHDIVTGILDLTHHQHVEDVERTAEDAVVDAQCG